MEATEPDKPLGAKDCDGHKTSDPKEGPDNLSCPATERPTMSKRTSQWLGSDDHLTLSFESLTVQVPGVKKRCCSCVDNPIGYSMQEYLGMQIRECQAFCALSEVSGLVSTGEMCLVLSSNEVGMSTLIRALCGRLNQNDEVFGTILLNGMPIGPSNQGWRRLTSYVSASDTTHSPVLTVEETLAFATRCTSDGTLDNAGVHAKVAELLEILGLSHVADTVVGDENLRGVSGGQKVWISYIGRKQSLRPFHLILFGSFIVASSYSR